MLFNAYKKLLIIGLVILTAVLLYLIYWYIVAANIKVEIDDWVAARADQGLAVSYKKLSIRGFPLYFKIVIEKPKIQPLNFNATGKNIFAYKKWKVNSVSAVTKIMPWDLNKFEFYVSGLKVRNKQNKELVSVKSLLIVSNTLPSGNDASPTVGIGSAYALKIKSNEIHFAKFLKFPLGHDISQLSSDLRVTGFFGPKANIKSLDKWRDSGGIIEVRAFKTNYGLLMIDAVGTVALDKKLQPIAAMSAKFKGLFSTINRLKETGYIRPSDEALVRVILGIFSTRVGNGRRSISLPITLQDGQLSIGPASLMKVPLIVWQKEIVDN
jgi:hypothetical protein